MVEYVRVFETSSMKEVHEYTNKGWVVINTYKIEEDDDLPIDGGIRYVLGLSSKELSNKLIDIVKEYEKYGFKDALFGKIADEMGDRLEDYRPSSGLGVVAPLAKYMSNYEELVNGKTVLYNRNNPANYDDDDDDVDMPF